MTWRTGNTEHVIDDDRATRQILLDEVPQVMHTEEDSESASPAPSDWFYRRYGATGETIGFFARSDAHRRTTA